MWSMVMSQIQMQSSQMMSHGVRTQMIRTVEMTNHALSIHVLCILYSVLKMKMSVRKMWSMMTSLIQMESLQMMKSSSEDSDYLGCIDD